MTVALIIEDNDNNLELIRFILEKAGYETLFAITGVEGVKLALSHAPDMIILDIQLPDISGLEVLQQIRAHESGQNVPVIAMTSYAMSGDREKLIAAGCNNYIEKPIDPLSVMSLIKRTVFCQPKERVN